MSRIPTDEEIKAALAVYPEVALAVVYGSIASGRHMAASDLDLAVAAQAVLPVSRHIDIALALSQKLQIEVDLLDLNTAAGPILKQALTRGRRIMNRVPAIYARILKKLVYQEADFTPQYNRLIKERRDRFLRGPASH